MPRKANGLLFRAWIIFIVSLFMTAVDEDMKGWNCAATCAFQITNLKEWGGVYYFGFTIPNLFMLLSPIFVFRLDQNSPKIKWLIGVALFSALYVLSFGIINWISPGFELKPGYYLWLVSFWLLFFGFISLHAKPNANSESPQNISPLSKA